MTTEQATAIIAGYDGCGYSSDPEEARFGGGLDYARRMARGGHVRRAGECIVKMYADLGAAAPDDGDELANGWAWYHGRHPILAAIADDEAGRLSAPAPSDGY